MAARKEYSELGAHWGYATITGISFQ
jgi:hypothetical protein